MAHYSRVVVIFGLFFATALAEPKINLEDIERDNLRAESKSSSDNTQAEETSYSVTGKPETIKQKYQQQVAHQYQSDDESSGYEPSEQLQDKYSARPEEYQQDVKYLANNVDYQQTSQPIQQQYENYQQQVETSVPKSLSQGTTYETPQQQLYYQPEVTVGNQYQSVQQRTATEKYTKNSNKETLYVNIPMTQLLSYYPNLALHQPAISKSQVQPLFHRLASQAAQQIAIPIYAPSLSREQSYSPSRVAYQIQPQYPSYASKYQQQTEAIFPTKQPKKLIYSQALLSHQQQPQAHQQHYLQEIVYTQRPGSVAYAPSLSSSHTANVYTRPSSVHLEANGPGQSYASQTREQQQYASPSHQPTTHYAISADTYVPQLTNQIYQQQTAENIQQDYETIPAAPGNDLDLPRLPAQNFKSVVNTRLSLPIPNDSEDTHYTQNHLVHSSEPRSLLESYIPSHLIAAQNSERYRERPIKLERGFLPSKINFLHSYKKRKAE